MMFFQVKNHFTCLNVIARFIRVIHNDGKKIRQLLDAPTKSGHDHGGDFLIIIPNRSFAVWFFDDQNTNKLMTRYISSHAGPRSGISTSNQSLKPRNNTEINSA